MAKRPLPSPDLLRQLLRYEPESGRLFWKPRPASMFRASGRWTADEHCRAWNTKWGGKEAFLNWNTSGYRVGGVMGGTHRAHRVIWALVTGEWPIEIDHIDGDRSNNRWVNLREADRFINGKNIALPSDNTSGAIGVSWSKSRERWVANITAEGKTRQIGRYKNFEEAVVARRAAEAKLGFHPNHGRGGFRS